MSADKKRNHHVVELDENSIELLRQRLEERYWRFKSVPHAHWQAVRDKTNVTAYLSGKLCVQGKGTEEFVLFILEPEILKEASFGYEGLSDVSLQDEPFTPHAGVDESGKGDFFGPLVVAAVYVDDGSANALKECGVKDSKAIKSDAKIAALSKRIKALVGGRFSVVPIGPRAYNNLYAKIGNLNKLLAWGHARALENIKERVPECDRAVIDQFARGRVVENALMRGGRSMRIEQRTKGESDIAVAAASIIARDAFVSKLKSLGEELGVTLPKGAGPKVLETAGEIRERFGVDRFDDLAKTHFRVLDRVVDGDGDA